MNARCIHTCEHILQLARAWLYQPIPCLIKSHTHEHDLYKYQTLYIIYKTHELETKILSVLPTKNIYKYIYPHDFDVVQLPDHY